MTFTTNGKRQFLPRDQVFRHFSFTVHDLTKLVVSGQFYPKELCWTVFVRLLAILKNSQLESDVCCKHDSLMSLLNLPQLGIIILKWLNICWKVELM